MTRPLLLLHLSDLHFGPHCRFAGQDMKRLAAVFHQAVEEARTGQRFAEKVGLIVVTGDITEAALPRQYEMALAFFRNLIGLMGLAHRYVVFTPGNHDVSWAECTRVEIDQQEEGFGDDELQRRIHAVKLRRFEEFIREFYENDRTSLPHALDLGHGAFVYAFDDLKLSVACLNSCETESHRSHGGSLGTLQAQALMSHWQASPIKPMRLRKKASAISYCLHGDIRRWLKLVAVHHNPLAAVPAGVQSWVAHLRKHSGASIKPDVIEHFAADAAGFDGRERLRAIAKDCQVQLILHGHQHADAQDAWPWDKAKGQTLVLSAGSWGLAPDKLPEGQPTMTQLVRLDPEAEEIRLVPRVYEPRARAQGQVEPGTFAIDPAHPEGRTLHMSLPVGYRPKLSLTTNQDEAAAQATLEKDFIREYRLRLKCAYQRWDLASVGAVQAGGAGNPIHAQLDTMYVPLRLGDRFDIRALGAGAVLSPDDLLARRRPLVIRGAAGSGKTTWMKWTFRQLVEKESAVPLMIELRQLAFLWTRQPVRGEERTIDSYLRDCVAASGAGGWRDALPRILTSQSGPRPVLLVDGWDELGEIGEEFREQLMGFLQAHPRALAVVTSRPYGATRPSKGEDFDELDIQPLSDDEVALFTGRFFRQVYGEDEHAALLSTERFLTALRTSREAESLGRTALLLTMMLLISRDRLLPDKRHQLYDECLRNLLSARPDRKEVEGARMTREQWRPSDREERMRAVAELAFRVQATGYEQGRDLVVGSWDALQSMLTSSWKREEKEGFLAWLVGSAGIMVDRADSTLTFTHLSFQEYLAAWHLNATLEGEEQRKQFFRERMGDVDWWETLRIWAALVGDRNPGQLKPVLEDLIDGDASGFWLAGAILADGPGEEVFERWLQRLADRFHISEVRFSDTATRAWAASRQDARRARIRQAWPQISCAWTWIAGVIAGVWRDIAQIQAPTPANDALDVLLRGAEHGKGVGWGRVLHGSHPLWPWRCSELVVLRLWPAYRVHASAQLQMIVSLGGNRQTIVEASRRLLGTPAERSASEGDWARDQAWDFARDWSRDWTKRWMRTSGHVGSPHRVRDWVRDWARYWSRDWTQDWTSYLARDLARNWGLAPDLPWMEELAAAELFSAVGRSSTRRALASVKEPAHPTLQLFQAACRASLDCIPNAPALNDALARFPHDADPLWPALARHIARRSSPEDRALLEDVARQPERRDGALSWGLQYYVRGDLILPDGGEITLNALCEEVGLPHLPYLEDMPDEVRID